MVDPQAWIKRTALEYMSKGNKMYFIGSHDENLNSLTEKSIVDVKQLSELQN